MGSNSNTLGNNNNVKKITLFQLIALSVAFYGSIRNVPTVASAGWEAIFFMIAAGILFAIPISLVAAELATGWPQEGGPQVWVKEALGEKWSFVTAWLLWVQMFFGMVMVSSAFATMVAYMIGKPELAQNNKYIVVVVIATYWIVTLLNFKAKFGKWVSTFGAVIGIYIPFVILVVLGLWYAFTHGNVNLGPLTLSSAIPNLASISKLSFFSGIIFIFAGLEIASVHANDIENPKKNYPVAVFITIGAMIVFNLLAGLTEANAIPAKDIQLATITQPFQLYFNELGIPFATNIIAGMIAIGIFAQLSAWVLGPSKAMIKVAEDGNLPPVFQKRNKDGIPVTFVLIQATVISIVALLYIVVPQVNTGFFMILILTTIIYSIVYIFILLSEILLKYKRADVKRAFEVPGGKVGMWITCGLAFIGVALTIIISFIPSSDIPQKDHMAYVAFQAIGTLICFVIPLIIFKFKKDSWKKISTNEASKTTSNSTTNANNKEDNDKNNKTNNKNNFNNRNRHTPSIQH